MLIILSFCVVWDICQRQCLHSFLALYFAATDQTLLLEHQSRPTLGHHICPGGEFRPIFHDPKLLIGVDSIVSQSFQHIGVLPNWACSPSLSILIYRHVCNPSSPCLPCPHTHTVTIIRRCAVPFKAFAHGISSAINSLSQILPVLI